MLAACRAYKRPDRKDALGRRGRRLLVRRFAVRVRVGSGGRCWPIGSRRSSRTAAASVIFINVAQGGKPSGLLA